MRLIQVIVFCCIGACLADNSQSAEKAKDIVGEIPTILSYRPVDDGYQIFNSLRRFNRGLYCGHEQDNLTEKYVTFAGDQPIIMGAVTDWRNSPGCKQAKCGTFMAGVCYTPGIEPSKDVPRFSTWFHNLDGTLSTFRNGWMEYQVNNYLQCFPIIKANIEVLPLSDSNGFLVHLNIKTDQRVNFVIAYGGITDFFGRFEYPTQEHRDFSDWDCRDNTVIPGNNRALVKGSDEMPIQTQMWIGSSFPMEVTIADAKNAERPGSLFNRSDEAIETPMACMKTTITQGQTLDGYIVVLRNAPESELDRWLGLSNPVERLKEWIIQKRSVIQVDTPDTMLDLTIAPNVIAMDACWHKNVFHHGTYGWHAPYMGWRNWYGPTVIGWHDRVQKAFTTHAAAQLQKTDQPETVVYKGPKQYAKLKNSYGFIPEMPEGKNSKRVFYNMQEVGIDMILHDIKWTGDVDYAKTVFDNIDQALAWETRILDPEDNGLYQNWLNTWVSDAHSYNGGDCAQASAYNYHANRIMAVIARRIGKDPKSFLQLSDKIKNAFQQTLWLPDKGVVAEYKDTIGNKLIHPSPELATIYHSIEAGIVDPFQAYQMLRFSETQIRNYQTIARGGRLAFSSNWYPHNYSSSGLYTAENMHLAWAYFQNGQIEKANNLLTALVDAHFLSNHPGVACHCMAPNGFTYYCSDFSEISSMHLRLIVEGLFGIRRDLLENQITIAPGLPEQWDHAGITIPDAALTFNRQNNQTTVIYNDTASAHRLFKIPLYADHVRNVTINNEDIPYRIEPGINLSYLTVETDQTGELGLKILTQGHAIDNLVYNEAVNPADPVAIKTPKGHILEIKDPGNCLKDIHHDDQTITAVVVGQPGNHTIFVRVKQNEWEAWLTADLTVIQPPKPKLKTVGECTFQTVDIANRFNMSLAEIHQQEYWSPRPKGYSIMSCLNGRFGWSWNHAGQYKVKVDDLALRNCGGTWKTQSGIPFKTPAQGPNALCVSIWDNYPDQISIDLSGSADELAVWFITSTSPMQARVENARFTVQYTDGSTETVSLVNPVNIDDWLTAAFQKENESQYFSEYNHAIIQRIPLNPEKTMKSFKADAVANEIILGILGLTKIHYDG